MLDISEFTAQIRRQNPILGLALEQLQDSVNHLGIVTGNDPTGLIEDAPTPPQALQVSAGGGILHATVTDTSARSRPLNYFLEFDNDPAFPQPHMMQMGAGREAILPLPNEDSDGNQLNYYVRAYSMLPGSVRASDPVVFGGSANPTAIQVGGATQLTLQDAPGGGTASASGWQGGEGFGPTMLTPEGPTIASQVAQGANSGGSVQPGTFSAGDGLIHGDSIWEIDPGCIYYRDDFTHQAPTSLAIGDLGWTSDINASSLTFTQHATPHTGCVSLVNGTSNGCSTIYWTDQGSTNVPWGGAMPLLDYPPWKMVFVFNFDQAGNFTSVLPANAFAMTKKTFYMGCQMNLGSPTNTRPTIYFGLRYDTDTTSPAIGDTTFWFEGVANSPSNIRVNTQGTTYNTGVTPANGNWYRFEMLCTVAGEVQFTLVDETNAVTVTQTLTIPQFSQTLSSSQINSTLGMFEVSASNYQYTPYGGKVTFSGMTHIAGLNGVQTLLGTSGGNMFGTTSLSAVSSGTETGHVTGNFGCLPFVTFGNDTESSPVANVTMNWDFFGFAWNPGVGGGTATPNPLKSRYW